jgi:hypothetical protein
MYDSSNRNTAPLEGKLVATGAVMDDMEVLERAIALVRENAPAHRELISRLASSAQAMAGIQPISGLDEQLMAYTDRPKAMAKTVLEGLRYNR